MPRDAVCRTLRRRSGRVNSRDRRDVVWYRVLGLVPWETIEVALFEAEGPLPFRFTDGWRAQKAKDLVRLMDALRRTR